MHICSSRTLTRICYDSSYTVDQDIIIDFHYNYHILPAFTVFRSIEVAIAYWQQSGRSKILPKQGTTFLEKQVRLSAANPSEKPEMTFDVAIRSVRGLRKYITHYQRFGEYFVRIVYKSQFVGTINISEDDIPEGLNDTTTATLDGQPSFTVASA